MNIIYLPKGQWQLEIGMLKSAPAPYEEPIFMRGQDGMTYLGLTEYWEQRAGIYHAVPFSPSSFTIIDQTLGKP